MFFFFFKIIKNQNVYRNYIHVILGVLNYESNAVYGRETSI